MSIAHMQDERGTGNEGASRTLELRLSRTHELLVRRTGSPEWWSMLARNVEDLARAVEAHAEGCEVFHRQLLGDEPRLAFHARSLERDHVELTAELSELKAIVASSATQPSGLPIALAATTEAVARIRGHERRAGQLLHEAVRRDLGGGG